MIMTALHVHVYIECHDHFILVLIWTGRLTVVIEKVVLRRAEVVK